MSDKERLRRSLVLWSVISVLTALFAAVYESMSHGVVSLYMTGAFAIPLLLGALTRAVLPALHVGAAGEKSAALWDLGVGTLLSGSLVQGALVEPAFPFRQDRPDVDRQRLLPVHVVHSIS